MKDIVVINKVLHKYAECWELDADAELRKELDRVLDDYAYGGFDFDAIDPSEISDYYLDIVQAQISNGEYIGKADKLVILCNAIKASQERFNNVGWELQGQSRETATESPKKPFPDELNTDEWKRVLPKLIEKGFVIDTPQGYRWNEPKYTKALFIYLVGRVYGGDKSEITEYSKGKGVWIKGSKDKPVPGTALERYWGIPNIARTIPQRVYCPRGYKEIDKLID